MRTAPSTLTAMIFLAVFLCLVIPSRAVFACTECICFSDNTCSDVECLPGLTTNCSRTTFTPACDGSYTFFTKVTCTGGASCKKCMSCASLFVIDQGVEVFFKDIHNNGCNGGTCLSPFVSATLSTNRTYAIYVCKVPCPDGSSTCEECVASCTAHACLSYGPSPTSCVP
jgi:hypothetical protein